MKIFLVSRPRWVKTALQVAFDASVLGFSYFFALVLATGSFTAAMASAEGRVLALALPPSLGLFFGLRSYHSLVRFVAAETLAKLLAVYIGAGLCFYLAAALMKAPFGWAAAVIFVLLASFQGIGARFFVRGYLQGSGGQTKKNVLIYGAGDTGRQLLGNIQRSSDLYPVGFVDDSPDLAGKIISGVMVYPTDDLESLIAQENISVVLVAIQNLSPEAQDRLAALVACNTIKIQKIPAVADILSGKTKITHFREVRIEELLGREQVQAMPRLLDINSTGKTLVVTGAGGSIGSEICRQLLGAAPAHLVLVEASEYALYKIEQSLSQAVCAQGLRTKITPVLLNVCKTARLTRVLTDTRADMVFHAAAYKHVPMLEHNVLAGLANNVLGTHAVVKAALAAGIKNLTMVSTDKAVRPTNVMGASKRFAELVCQAYAWAQSGTKISMVRFGNVLGSSGSVVPLFKEQIKKGGPVTVTHRQINRYFMTIPEASQLVIQAAGLAKGGEVFVLDMGKPVRILDLARSMIHLSGYQPFIRGEPITGPDTGAPRMEIVISKLRPGEKLYEELLIDAVAKHTRHPRIMRARERRLSLEELTPYLHKLETCLQTDNTALALELLQALPLDYTPPQPKTSKDIMPARLQKHA